MKKGIQPQESKYEIAGIVIEFFPPISLDNLNATILIYGKDSNDVLKNNSISSQNSNIKEGENSTKGETEKSPHEYTDINDVDEYGVTQLAHAAHEGNIELVKQLLSQGADPNLQKGMGEPPLTWAVRGNRDNIVKLLLESGANPNYKNSEEETPLSIAKENGANATIHYLLDYGAKE